MYEPYSTFDLAESEVSEDLQHFSPSSRDESSRLPLRTLETIIFNQDVPATPNSIYGRKDTYLDYKKQFSQPRYPESALSSHKKHRPSDIGEEENRPIFPETEQYEVPTHSPLVQLRTTQFETDPTLRTPVKPGFASRLTSTGRKHVALRSLSNTEHKTRARPKSASKDTFLSRMRRSVNDKYTMATPGKTIDRKSSRQSSRKSLSTDRRTQDMEKLLTVVTGHCRHCMDMKRVIAEAGLSHLLLRSRK